MSGADAQFKKMFSDKHGKRVPQIEKVIQIAFSRSYARLIKAAHANISAQLLDLKTGVAVLNLYSDIDFHEECRKIKSILQNHLPPEIYESIKDDNIIENIKIGFLKTCSGITDGMLINHHFASQRIESIIHELSHVLAEELVCCVVTRPSTEGMH